MAVQERGGFVMTDTPEKRVEEAARAIERMQLLDINGSIENADDIATAALASSERIIAEQEARIAELESALTECADDLESEVEARRPVTLPRRIDRDLGPVVRARAILAAPT